MRVCERERVSVCVCVCECESACVCERESVRVCERERETQRERESVCVCVMLNGTELPKSRATKASGFGHSGSVVLRNSRRMQPKTSTLRFRSLLRHGSRSCRLHVQR